MASAASSVDKTVWKAYQDIEQLVMQRYKLSSSDGDENNPPVSQALRRLGEAVLLAHHLQETPKVRKWTMILAEDLVKRLSLSTIDDMFRAKIPTLEYAPPSRQDASSREPESTHIPQPSLQEVVGHSYAHLKIIVETTPEQAWKMFHWIESAVQEEIERLNSISKTDRNVKNKVIDIREASARLHQALLYQYPQPGATDDTHALNIEQSHAEVLDLSTVDAMLDAKCREWASSLPPFTEWSFALVGGRKAGYEPRSSLREALNIPRHALLRVPLFGSTRSAYNVERKLETLALNDPASTETT